MTADRAVLKALERVLDGAALWGLELDTRYRVLAATVEPSSGRHPYGPVPDRRLQLLLYPCSKILASLRSAPGDGHTLETFEVDQLLEVVESFNGATLSLPLFDLPEPTPGEWGPEPSLQGASNTGDGTAHSLRLSLDGPGGRRFAFYASFDDVRVRDPNGRDVVLT